MQKLEASLCQGRAAKSTNDTPKAKAATKKRRIA